MDCEEVNPKVEQLLKMPQYEQRTTAWYEQRKNAITASDIPTVLGENNYKSSWSLFLDKCNATEKPFVGNEATRWGNHYEDIAIEKYSELRNKKVLSFGLLIHRDYPWLGGSPDGITTDGILLEVKCPLRRKIVHGEVPHHYLSQVLLNLEICDLDVAHFIEFIPGNSDDSYEINIVEVLRDREWFSTNIDKIKEFWDSVIEYRNVGVEKHPKYKNYKERSDNLKKNKEGITLNLIDSHEPKNTFVNFIESEESEEPWEKPEPQEQKVKFVNFIDSGEWE
jgi:putative phage-type endonuclease